MDPSHCNQASALPLQGNLRGLNIPVPAYDPGVPTEDGQVFLESIDEAALLTLQIVVLGMGHIDEACAL